MYALSISESNFCRGEERSDLGVVGERMAVIMRRKFTGSNVSGPEHVGSRSRTGQRRHHIQPPTRVQSPSSSHKMSSVTFPDASHYSMSSIHSNDEAGDSPYGSSFGAAHGIQMNPHSPHPPRTPRTSIAYSSGYDLPASSPKRISATLDVEPEEQRVDDHPAKTRVRSEEVWREIVKSSDGRDKAFVRHVSIPLYILF